MFNYLKDLFDLKERLAEVKRLEKNHREVIKELKAKVNQDRLKGYIVEADLKDKIINGDIYLLGEGILVTGNFFKGKMRG